VDQELVERKADTPCQRPEAVDIGGAEPLRPAALGPRIDVRETEGSLGAEHPWAGLIVPSDLSTANRAIARSDADERGGRSKQSAPVRPRVVGPTIGDVKSGVEPAPGPWRDRGGRRHDSHIRRAGSERRRKHCGDADPHAQTVTHSTPGEPRIVERKT